ncbi:hypothetical protein DOY81_000342 [Sarcophaga bullata]|nr:hypothetical protein DOY81_000342 [Sarcophaga bullata]
MKFLNRATFGIIVGVVNIIFILIVIVYLVGAITQINQLSEEEKQRKADIMRYSITELYILLIVCIFSIFITILLIVGIIKRCYTLMRPWICAGIAGIIYHIFLIIIDIVVGFTTDLPFGTIILAVLLGLLVVGIEILIFYPIYTLYTDIRDGANEQEQRNFNNPAPNPPSYSDLENGNKMYN